jgi:hypothetical protein
MNEDVVLLWPLLFEGLVKLEIPYIHSGHGTGRRYNFAIGNNSNGYGRGIGYGGLGHSGYGYGGMKGNTINYGGAGQK